MTKRTRGKLVTCALAACVAFVFVSAGCRRDEGLSEEAGAPTAGQKAVEESDTKVAPRLADKEYKEALKGHMSKRSELLKTRDALVTVMRERVNTVRASLANDDESVLAAELSKDPEWASLRARFTDLNKALEDNRRNAAAIVRDRIHADIEKANLK